MDRNVLLDVLEQAFRPLIEVLERAISVIPITDKGSSIEVPQVEQGKTRNISEVVEQIVCIFAMIESNKYVKDIRIKEVLTKVLTEWDNTVTTVPDAHDYMQEMRRYLQHYDNKEMSAASLIDVFVKEINRYFE